MDDPEKRNENWIWYIPEGTEKGEWREANDGDYPEMDEGTFYSFFFNGKQSRKWQLKSRKLIGQYIVYDLDGKLSHTSLYRNGEEVKRVYAEGPYHLYGFDGIIQKEGLIKDGKFEGVWKYYKDGDIVLINTFEKGVLQGPLIAYHPNGTMKDSSFRINGKETCIAEDWHPNGQLASISPRIDSKNEGLQLRYFDSGVLRDSFYSTNGLTHGYYLKKFQNGNWHFVGSFFKGDKDGPYKQFHENGVLEMEGSFDKGRKEGLWKYYYDNGVLEETGMYEKDMEVGTWQKYDRTGKLKIE